MATFNFERRVLSRPLGRWDSEAIVEGREEMVRYTNDAEIAEPADDREWAPLLLLAECTKLPQEDDTNRHA